MSNTGEFYDHTTYPVTRSTGTSAGLRQELDLVEAGFNKLPPLSGNALRLVKVGSGGTDMTVAGIYEDASNRVLIGTNASRSIGGAARQLQLESASQSSVSLVRNTNDNVGSLFIGGKSRGTAVGSSTAVTSGDELMQLAASGGDGTNMTPVAAAIQFSVDGAVATGQVPGRIDWYTTPTGASSPVARMRLNNQGALTIGSTAVLGSERVRVVGDIQTDNANYFKSRTNAGTATRLFGINASDVLYIGSIDAAHASTVFVNNGAIQATLTSAGNFGIGAAPVSRLLELHNTTRSIARIQATQTTGTDAISGIEFHSWDGASVALGASLYHVYSLQSTEPNSVQLNVVRNASFILKTNNADAMRVDGSGALTLVKATAALGYGTGAGGTVTQLTSKATGVTLNRPSGQITMNGAALAAATAVSFTLTNSVIGTTDVVHACIDSAATAGAYSVTVDAVGAGTCQISLRNHTAGSLSEAVVLNFVVLRAATA